MEVPNGDAAIVPYLNPEYWDDHSIGYCDHASDPMSPPLRTGGVERRARRLLEGQLTTGRMFPHETYMNGQVFSPVAYELGTVVLCRQEQLYGSAPLAPDPRFVAGNTLPNRPTDILPKFASEQSQSAFIGSHDRAMYASQALWGIVAENRQQRKALYTVMAALVDRAGDGR